MMLQSPIRLVGKIVLGLLVVVTLLVLGARQGWWQRGGVWGWWLLWLLLVGGVVTALLIGVWVVWQRLAQYRQQRFLARAAEGEAPQETDEAHTQQLHDKMRQAIQTLEQSPQLKQYKGLPLYAVPWYVLLGASQSGKTTLLQSVASSFAPFVQPHANTDMPTQDCDWWFFNTAIVLDTAGRYTCQAAGEQERAHWYRFLQMLRTARPLQPVNGLIVTVAADRLATASQDELRLEATAVRKRIDEAIRELGVNFPVYLLLTRCDLIEGFTTFFGQVPEATHQQVFGYMHEVPPQGNEAQPASPAWQVADIFDTLVERLEQLRLAMFDTEHVLAATVHQQIFCFPEEFRALQQPLSAFVMALLEDNPFQHRATFRGLFFSSARQQQTPISLVRRPLGFQPPSIPQPEGMRPYFLHDLFAVILRRDQYLATATRQARRGRWWRHLVSVSSSVGCCLLLVLLLTRACWNDRQVYAASDPTACTTETSGQSLPSRLEQIETCRTMIETLQTQQKQRLVWSTWMFDHSGALAAQLRRRYVERFTAALLEPLDAELSQHLSAGVNPVPLVFVLMQRLELLTQCQGQPGCPPALGEARPPDYQLMADPGRQDPRAADLAPVLRQAYEAYVRWASYTTPEVVRREQEGHTERLRRWFTTRQLALPQVLAWANQHYTPVRMQTYWDTLPPGDEKKAVQVDGAYTRQAWQQGLQPLLHRAEEAVPDMAPLLQVFQEEYRAQYFAQWQRFLAAFPRGEAPWSTTRELRRRLAAHVLTERSPYNRIIDVVQDHVQPFLSTAPATAGAATAAVPLPAWVRGLQHYAGSASRQAYVEMLKQLGRQVASDVPPEKSLALVQAGFQEGQPTAQSTHPVLKAWGLIEHLRDQAGAGTQAPDQVVWPLLERPVRLGWKVLLDEAGALLQKQWTAGVVTPIQGLSDLEQVDILYGPQGKVRAFAEQFTKPFLADNATRPVQVLGEEVPLAPGFVKTLQDDRQLRPLLELGKATPYRVRVEGTRATVLESPTNVVEEQTDMVVECDGKLFKGTTRARDTQETATTVPWTLGGCGDVLLTVALTCDGACVKRAATMGLTVPQVSSVRLSKRYPGPAGLLRFMHDFRSGSHAFRAAEFTTAAVAGGKVDDAVRVYQIQTIQIFYQVDVPASLTKLYALIPSPVVPPTILK